MSDIPGIHILGFVVNSPLFFALAALIANFAIAGFSILIWLVYKNQLATMRDALEETRKSNETAERSLVLGRRAWIIPEVQQVKDGELPWPEWIKIYMPNRGGVPAVIKRDGAHAFLLPEGARYPDAFPNTVTIPKWEGGAMTPPNAPFPTTLHYRMPKFSAEELAAVDNGTRAMCLYCEVEYTDVFGKPWKTVIGCWRSRDRNWYIAPRYSKVE